jgi:hypothetical protein
VALHPYGYPEVVTLITEIPPIRYGEHR